jgi:hypothetical protein
MGGGILELGPGFQSPGPGVIRNGLKYLDSIPLPYQINAEIGRE